METAIVDTRIRKLPQTKIFAYFMITMAAIVYIFGIQAIMQVAQCLPSGLGALPLVLTMVVKQLSPYYGLLYLALNIPLIVLFYRKIRPKFMIRTCYFLLVSTAFSSIFFIEDVERWFQTLIIHVTPKNGQTFKEALAEEATTQIWPMLVLPAVGGTFVGATIAISWKYGGSTGGTDIVVYYLSTKRKKQIGSISFMVSIVILLLMFSVLVGLEPIVRREWLPSIVGSFAYISVSSLVVNAVFPKYSKVQVEIHSAKMSSIIDHMRATHVHAYRIQTATSGYTGSDVKYVTTVMLLLEVKGFMKKIKAIDNEAWISVIAVSRVFGRFNTNTVDSI